LGYCYWNGQGVEANCEEAIKWYKLAAEKENASAQYELGMCYYFGTGVDKDLQTARSWFEKAAAQGNKDAAEKLKELNA
jgi:TPR repeat protein